MDKRGDGGWTAARHGETKNRYGGTQTHVRSDGFLGNIKQLGLLSFSFGFLVSSGKEMKTWQFLSRLVI